MRFVQGPDRRCAPGLAALALATFPFLLDPAFAQTPADPASERPVAVDARVTQAGEATRLSFSLSRIVEARAFVMERPDRVVIDLPEVNFQAPPQAGRTGKGLIAGFRYGLFAPGRSRIVIDLAGPAKVASLQSSSAAGIASLAIELERVDRAAFARLAAGAQAESRPAAPREGVSNHAGRAPAGETRPTVVIDPGHGGIDPGAVTAQIAEKHIVLAFGQKLRDLLVAGGRYRVIMTRDDDRFLPLGERVAIARQNGADLFISIHADSLSATQDVRGATIYTASESATDAESARLASRENQVDALAGVDVPNEAREEVADILVDLAKRETRAFSAALATTLVRAFTGEIRLHKTPQRAAGFRVLSAPDVPSALIELGYVSSAKDVEALTSEAWRTKAAEAARRAIDGFFDARNGRGRKDGAAARAEP